MNLWNRNCFFCLIIVLSITTQGFAQTIVNGSLNHDGLEREYLLYVPATYAVSNSEVPLVINFHGYTSNARDQMFYGDFRAIADREGFLIVHPQGTRDNTGTTYWNAQWRPNGVDDIGFTAALIDTIAEKYTVDKKRVYSTGMSNGGFMSYTLACELADKIAAIASVTGSMTRDQIDRTCLPEKLTPVMQIHGTADEVVPYAGNSWMAPVEDVMSFWRERNTCNDFAEVIDVEDSNTTDQSTVQQEINKDCSENSTIEFFKILGGTHTWPGSVINFGVTNYDITASEEIWRFFSQYNLDGPLSSIVKVESKQLSFNYYPTLVTTSLNLSFPETTERTLIVYDLQGRKLIEKSSEDKSVLLDLSTLDPGMFILQVTQDQNKNQKRIMKI